MPLPPWLNISGRDFMQAIESGDAAGRALAEQQSQADERSFQRWMQGQQLREQALKLVTDTQRQRTAEQQLNDYRMREAAVREAENARQQLRDTETGRHNKATEGATRIHFGPNGQVLSEKDGDISVLREPDKSGTIKYRGAHVHYPQDEFGPDVTGPSDNPDIISRTKAIADKAAKAQADAAAAAAEPGILSKAGGAIKSWFTPPSSPLQAPRTTAITEPKSALPQAVAPQPTDSTDEDGTRAKPYNPASQQEFDDIESGEYYVNPKDGRLMQKK